MNVQRTMTGVLLVLGLLAVCAGLASGEPPDRELAGFRYRETKPCRDFAEVVKSPHDTLTCEGYRKQNGNELLIVYAQDGKVAEVRLRDLVFERGSPLMQKGSNQFRIRYGFILAPVEFADSAARRIRKDNNMTYIK